MNKFILVVLLMATPIMSNAEGDTKRETIERLLVVTNVDAMIDAMYSQIDNMFVGMGKELGVKESEQQIFDNFMAKVTSAMKEEMTWERMKGPMIDVYLKHYSQKELDDMLAFYETETGKSIINKMPAVMADSMLVSQDMFKNFMPRLNELSREFRDELQQVRKGSE